MLIYEKDNKLNINFDNEVSEQPDLQISKEDGKTEVLIDGQPGSGGGGALVVHFTYNAQTGYIDADKTCKEILDASKIGPLIGIHEFLESGDDVIFSSPFCVKYKYDNGYQIASMELWALQLPIFDSNYTYCDYSDDNTQWTIPD